ncbi:5-hydroxytryptamine receptor 1F-like [Ylistrum balloti]|uniref:5-hydroxytryptamine receptor 1F-like n=1 Tax=Ylistrum balloti TaxID=509963 RepID=UPI002905C575|nr:5-hydroxytryptamine receptor 1F-like [Ylistrum balloti]
MNLSTNVTYSLEDEDYDEFRKTGIPITVYLIVLCVLGTIGNVHVFLVYLLRYKSNIYKTFVLCLAAVDFLGCTFCIPASLYIIRHPNTIQSSVFCKVYRAAMNFVGAYSLILLDCIAVERYRKVCAVTRRQFTLRTTRVVCALTCLLVIVTFAIPGILTYGINQKITKPHWLVGYECMILENLKSSTFMKVYRGIIFVMFVFFFIISAVLYTLVGRKISVHKNKHKEICISRKKPISTEDVQCASSHSQEKDVSSDITTSIMQVPGSSDSNIAVDIVLKTTNHLGSDMKHSDSVESHHDQIRHTTETGNRYLNTLKERKRKELDRSRNITMVFLVVSILSFGGYLPYVLATLIRNINGPLYSNFMDKYGALDIFIRWMVFLNNAINPVVYGFMDKKFRKELAKFYTKLAHCGLLDSRHG